MEWMGNRDLEHFVELHNPLSLARLSHHTSDRTFDDLRLEFGVPRPLSVRAVVCARLSLASFTAGGLRSHSQRGSCPYMPKNGNTPAVSEAWLLAASGSQVLEVAHMAPDTAL